MTPLPSLKRPSLKRCSFTRGKNNVPCKRSPEFWGKILGFRSFFANAEKLGKSLEKPGVSGLSWFSRNSWKSPESHDKIFHAFRAFPYMQKNPGAFD